MRKTLKVGAMMLLGVAAMANLSSCAHYHHEIEPELPVIAAVNNISGSIASIDGTGIQGATVTMDGPMSGTVTTDANGYFIFSDVKVGEYNLKVDAAGKIGKSTKVTVKSTASGYNAVWNVLLASEESQTSIQVTAAGGEGETTSEALKGNDLAKIDVDVDVPASALSKPATITIAPIYSEEEAVDSRMVGHNESMLIGATISCSDPTVTIESPIDLAFNVDNTTITTVKAYKYINGAWTEIPMTTEGDKVVIAADEFTSYGIFAPVVFASTTTNKPLVFERSLWDNRQGAQPMPLGEAVYNYTVGTHIESEGTTVFTALLIECLARHFGANYFETKAKFPLNTRLDVGAWLEISGTQQVNAVSAAVGSRKVTGTQYGDVTINIAMGTRDHTGGSN